MDETVIYQLITCINELKAQIKKLSEDLQRNSTALDANTFELLKSN